MRHEAQNAFHGTPRRSSKLSTEADVVRRLRGEFQPVEQARADAQRLHDDPHPLAANFRERLDVVRSTELAVLRTEALGAVAQNTDEAGALVITVDPMEAARIVDQTAIELDRIEVERRGVAIRAVETSREATASYDVWCDRSGAQRRHSPWTPWSKTLLFLSAAGLIEVVVVAQILDGAPVEGVPSGFVLGLMFGVTSLAWGVLGAVGSSLVADWRWYQKLWGWLLVLLAVGFWIAAAVTGAHMRAVIEAGGGGTGPEIFESMRRGMLRPFVSPMALILVAASAAATAAAWLKWLEAVGCPLWHRGKDKARRLAEDDVRRAEQEHRAAIKACTYQASMALKVLETEAWRPANNGHQLEREVTLALAQARECMKAVDRTTRGLVADYVATVRRLRPGVDVFADTQLSPITDEGLGDAQALHTRVATLTTNAMHVEEGVAAGSARLAQLEVFHFQLIERLFDSAKVSHFAPGANLGIRN